MKLINTIIFAFLALSTFGQIRLDSIVQSNTDTNSNKSHIAFEYEEQNVTRLYGNDDSGEIIEIDITYNADDGSINNWTFVDNIFPLKIDHKYNSNEQVDTLFFSINGSALGHKIISYDEEKIMLIEHYNPDGSVFATKNYNYDNDLLSEISYYDVQNDYAELEKTSAFEYDEFERLVKQTRDQDGFTYLVDSMSYDQDGNMVNFYQFVSSVEGDSILQNEHYTSDPTQNFDDIINPLSIMKLLSDISVDHSSTLQYNMTYGNKIDKATVVAPSGETFESIWYYSGIVGTDERVLTTPISVYPNPTVDEIRIKSEEIMTKFYIYDFAGALISEGSPGDDNAIDVYHLSTGSYTVICSNKEDKHYFSQFVKQ